jgi:hypothetical protein
MNRTQLSNVLLQWFRKWKTIWQSVIISELQIACYLDVLRDLHRLTPQQLDAACDASFKKAHFFPAPADIRECAIEAMQTERSVFYGPPMLTYSDTLSPEERDAAAREYREKLQKVLGPPRVKSTPKRKIQIVRRGFKPASEQIEAAKKAGIL